MVKYSRVTMVDFSTIGSHYQELYCNEFLLQQMQLVVLSGYFHISTGYGGLWDGEGVFRDPEISYNEGLLYVNLKQRPGVDAPHQHHR